MSRAPTITLEPRIQGSIRPETVITPTIDGAAVPNLASYTWAIQGYVKTDATKTVLFTMSSGITSDATTITIVWTTADLGALDPGDYAKTYVLELTGTYSSKPWKVNLEITIHPEA